MANILLVDDEPEVRCSSRRLLELDVVLLDIRLPGMDGWELLQALHADGRVGRIVVIVASGDAGPDSEQRALALGCRRCLAKPFSLEELRGALTG